MGPFEALQASSSNKGEREQQIRLYKTASPKVRRLVDKLLALQWDLLPFKASAEILFDETLRAVGISFQIRHEGKFWYRERLFTNDQIDATRPSLIEDELERMFGELVMGFCQSTIGLPQIAPPNKSEPALHGWRSLLSGGEPDA